MSLRICLISLGAIILLSGVAGATSLEGRCNIRFFGESTLHDFEGETDCRPFSLESVGPQDGVSIYPRPEVIVAVAEMTTNNSSRDKKMRKMFDSDKFPEIRGHFADLDMQTVLQQIDGKVDLPDTLEFDLQIRDISRRVTAKISSPGRNSNQLHFTLDFPLSLSSYSLDPPGVLGIIRVADQVRVEVKVFIRYNSVVVN